MKRIITFVMCMMALLVTSVATAQTQKLPKGSTLAMYVEYGGKGVKFGLLAFTDANFRKYIPLENTELNIGLSKAIQTTGNISPSDISSAAAASYDTYNLSLIHI